MLDTAESRIKMNRVWAMPSADTLSIPPFRQLVKKYLHTSKVSVDPFARNCTWATYTNDLNPDTAAEYHLDAVEFLDTLIAQGVKADVGIYDPPYSPRQVKECYDHIGKTVTQQATQMVDIRRDVKNRLAELIVPGGHVLSFGWESAGMGEARNFRFVEIVLCCHGSGHNDTICTVERKIADAQNHLFGG
jgi:hypothetical protein